jgi:hypothetical protein
MNQARAQSHPWRLKCIFCPVTPQHLTTLREVGDVTVVLSKQRRNDGPKQTKVLVTNLPQATALGTVACYLRRWPVELFFKEW